MDNVILIGMPGCGKSTVGIVLAKDMGYSFLDSDLLIQEREKKLLKDILKEEGRAGFNRIEDEVNASIVAEHSVIATGGSAVYGKTAMEHFKNIGTIVYIYMPYEEIEKRLGDFSARGISMEDGQSLRNLYDERTPLYEKYSDITVDASQINICDSVKLIREEYEKYKRDSGKKRC